MSRKQIYKYSPSPPKQTEKKTRKQHSPFYFLSSDERIPVAQLTYPLPTMRVISALVLILSTALVAAALPEAVPSLVARDNNDSSSLAAEAAEISSEDLSAEGHRKERKKAEKAIEKLNAKSSQLQSTLMELFNKKILWRPRGEDFNWIPGEEWEIQYNWCVEDKRWAYKLQFAKGRELDFMKAELLRCSTLMFTWRASTGKPSWFAHSCHWW